MRQRHFFCGLRLTLYRSCQAACLGVITSRTARTGIWRVTEKQYVWQDDLCVNPKLLRFLTVGLSFDYVKVTYVAHTVAYNNERAVRTRTQLPTKRLHVEAPDVLNILEQKHSTHEIFLRLYEVHSQFSGEQLSLQQVPHSLPNPH